MQKNIIILLIALTATFFCSCGGQKTNEAQVIEDTCHVVFNADSAFNDIVAQCEFGPRVPGTEAHSRCGDWIVKRFQSLGLTVEEQTAPITMWDGSVFKCRNIIAHYGNARKADGMPGSATPAHRNDEKKPFLFAAHWDSRPWADADPDESQHKQPVMAANDGASGVALMLELARHIAEVCPDRPVDFVCFDLEDYGKDDQENSFALGALHWSKMNRTDYEWGILFDMVGGEGAQFCYEGYSMRYAQWLVARTWSAATTAGMAEFFPHKDGGIITDDHVPMNEVAGIPTIDIIPYYNQAGIPSFGPTWHTTKDTPEHISRETLKGVGQTILQLLYEER